MQEDVFTADERELLVVLASSSLSKIDDPYLDHAKAELTSIIRKLGRSTTLLVARHGATSPEH